MNIFERATKQKLRFTSTRGQLTVEQLWDLSLGDLDTIARAVNTELKGLTEESFVEVTPNPETTKFKLKLDILKSIIASKLKDIETQEKRAETTAKRKAILEALSNKENEELTNMSKEDLLKQLEEL